MKSAWEKVDALTYVQRTWFARLRDGLQIHGNQRNFLVKKGLAQVVNGKTYPDAGVLAVFNVRWGVVWRGEPPPSWPFPEPGSPAFLPGAGIESN